MKSLSDRHGKQNGHLIDDRRSTQGNRFATDVGAASKETVGLIASPSGLSPPTARPSHGVELRASVCRTEARKTTSK